MSGLIQSSIARKVAMALSGLFLVFFLLQHFSINLLSVFSKDAFNLASHFMGTNPLVQFALQPVLIFGVVFHFIMGFILEIKNRGARAVKYASYNGGANASWMSRNMIFSGIAVLAFLALHFYDFWFPEMMHKYVHFLPEDPNRYFGELQHKFVSLPRTIFYCVAFVFLALHLLHGFASSFQSVGVNNKYSANIQKFAKAFAVVIPAGFIFIALFHHFSH